MADNHKPYSFVSFTTSQYKLHYYETPTNIKFVMLTDLKSPPMRVALQQIYINLFVEYGGCHPFHDIPLLFLTWSSVSFSREEPPLSNRAPRRCGCEQ